MCECNFKNPIWGHFLKKGAKIKKFWAYFEKCYNEFDFALRMRVVLENKYCGGIFFPNLFLEQYEPLLWTSCPPTQGGQAFLNGDKGWGLPPLHQARGALPPLPAPICAATYNLDWFNALSKTAPFIIIVFLN